MNTSANGAAIINAKESGVKMKKEWISITDRRTRHSHRNIDGSIVGIDTPFDVNGTKMMQPGVRMQPNGDAVPPRETVNCRCTMGFIVVEKGVRMPKPKLSIKPPPVPINTPPVFVAAKSIKDAEDYAINVLNAKYANFKGLDLGVVNDMNLSLFKTKQVMPKLEVSGIGSAQKANAAMKAEAKEAYIKSKWYQKLVTSYGQSVADRQANRFVRAKVENVGPNTMAWSTNRTAISIPGELPIDVSKYRGVFVNEKYGKSKDVIDKDVQRNEKTGWFTKGAKDFGYIMTHELGHEVDKLINFRNNPAFIAIYEREHAKGIESVIKNLSTYGATAGGKASHKPTEMIAEAWAEFITSDSPRPLAKELGELMLKEYYLDNIQGTGTTFTKWVEEALKIIKQ